MTAKTGYLLGAVAAVVLVVVGVLAFRHGHRPAPPAAIVRTPTIAPTPNAAPPADCLLPGPAPVPPDGYTASAADMKLGHDTIQNFVLQLEAYQTCRMAQLDHAAPQVTAQQKQTWLDDGNSAVDEANALASAYATQMRAFKARVPPPR